MKFAGEITDAAHRFSSYSEENHHNQITSNTSALAGGLLCGDLQEFS
jgi:hypothetical protein